jgi:hypothetical protein
MKGTNCALPFPWIESVAGAGHGERQNARLLHRTMLGDTQVTLPSYEATLGVTINTAPEAIWPWLMQMGYRRGRF